MDVDCSIQAGPGRRKEMNWHRDGATGLLHLGILGVCFVSNFWECFSLSFRPMSENPLLSPFLTNGNISPGITKARWFALHLHLPAFTLRHIHDFYRKKCDEDHLEWQATLTATGLDRRGVDTRALHDGRFLGI